MFSAAKASERARAGANYWNRKWEAKDSAGNGLRRGLRRREYERKEDSRDFAAQILSLTDFRAKDRDLQDEWWEKSITKTKIKIMVNYIYPIFCNTNPQSELYAGYKRIMNIDARRMLQICEIWIRVGENPGGRGCSFFVRVICIEENYSTFISSTGNETSEIFQKLNIRCIWIFRHAKEDLRNCVGVMNYRTRPGKTHLLLYFYVESEGLRAI